MQTNSFIKFNIQDFPGCLVVKTLQASTSGGTGLIPDQGTKIPHATQPNNFKIN